MSEQKEERQTFEQAIIAAFSAAIKSSLAEHPELRSVVVVFDYAGKLNDSQIDKAIWLGEDGAVTSLPAVLGSIHNTMHLLDFMFKRSSVLEHALRDRLYLMANELVQKEEQKHVQPAAAEKIATNPAILSGQTGKRQNRTAPQNSKLGHLIHSNKSFNASTDIGNLENLIAENSNGPAAEPMPQRRDGDIRQHISSPAAKS